MLQNIKGTPKVIHFTRQDYKTDSKFWCMTESKDNGTLYFGNQYGVNVYNGESWSLVRLPNGSAIRSLLCSKDGTIYVGANNEFGKMVMDIFGHYSYQSLLHLIPEKEREFLDLWQIIEAENQLILRTFKKLIILDESKGATITARDRFESIYAINGILYAMDGDYLKKINLQNLESKRIINTRIFDNQEICGILPGSQEDEALIFSKEGNIYSINLAAETINYSKNILEGQIDQVFCVLKSREGLYYAGTVNNQILTFKQEEHRLVKYREIKTLQDHTVLKLYQTLDGNIWALLNRGIDCLETSSPTSVIFENAGIYNVLIIDHKLYLATNQGVYWTEAGDEQNTFLDRSDFEIMEGLEAQTWSFAQINDEILISHDRGVFVMRNNSFYHIPGTNGILEVLPIKGDKNHYLACGYDGFYILHHQSNGQYVFKGKIEGFEFSTQYTMPTHDDRTFWVGHWESGVYKVRLDEDLTRLESVEHYTEKNGLPSSLNLRITTWDQDTVFLAEQGAYTFDNKTEEFSLHPELTEILGATETIQKIVYTPDITWVIKNNVLGFFYNDSTNKDLHQDRFLGFKNSFIAAMEYLLPLPNDQGILIGTESGIYLYDLSSPITQSQAKCLFTKISYLDSQDSLIFAPLNLPGDKILRINHGFQQLKFEFSNNRFMNQKDVQFSYQLDDRGNWSSWSTTPTLVINYLEEGEHTLKVHSKALLGGISQEATYHFQILPIWYRSFFARLSFIILTFLTIIVASILVRRKIRNTRIIEQKRRSVLELELQQIKLEREKERIEKDKQMLEEDVIFKSKELANYTMLLVKKQELLTQLRDDLKGLREIAKNEKSRDLLRNLMRKIGIHLNDEEHIHVFEANFERVHHAFFQELKTHFPDLTTKELRLCALVKMNLTNKEIAPILNISLRGVETARYRLRKRLSLEHEENMVEFLEKLAP